MRLIMQYTRVGRTALWAIPALTCLVAAGGCGPERSSTGDSGQLSCFVSVPPQAYFVERIGDGRVDVRVLIAPGQSPATYDPTPKQWAALAHANLYFAIGVPFENRILPRMRGDFPDLEVVEAQKGIQTRAIDRIGGTDIGSGESHRTDGQLTVSAVHRHETTDPHIWLNPRLAKTIASNIRDALVRLDSVYAREYEANYRSLAADLDELDRDLASVLEPLEGAELLVFHPAYGYFADAYGLEQVAIETGGVTPGSRHLASVIEHATARGVSALFVQPQFSSTSAERVAEQIGADVIVLDPLAGDYIKNLREMAHRIQNALAGE
jgi:zinc transport system substrate-binding protein